MTKEMDEILNVDTVFDLIEATLFVQKTALDEFGELKLSYDQAYKIAIVAVTQKHKLYREVLKSERRKDYKRNR
jgi:hypothetical protein